MIFWSDHPAILQGYYNKKDSSSNYSWNSQKKRDRKLLWNTWKILVANARGVHRRIRAKIPGSFLVEFSARIFGRIDVEIG